jgi:hypothetical protein
MSSLTGGQRRTIEYECGFRIVGHPNEVNQKHKRHMRLCPVCVDTAKNLQTLPDFDKDIGRKNGWKGLTTKGVVKEKVAFAYRDGESIGFIREEGNSIEKVIEKTNKKDTKNKEEEEIEKILQYLNAKSL